MEKTVLVPTERLLEEPYISIFCYPRPSRTEAAKRLKALEKLSVTAVSFEGEKRVFDMRVLGKGYVGIVVAAYVNDEKIALKIRRVDADRASMEREAALLEKANSVGVGPRMLYVSKDFVLMKFVDGSLLPEWLEKKRSKTIVKTVLREVLEQCLRLDSVGLDHGELSNAPKHVIVDKENKPVIVDFETASLSRRPSNVTALCQFLFIGSGVAMTVAKKLGRLDKKAIVEVLRVYKNDRSSENFGHVLTACGL